MIVRVRLAASQRRATLVFTVCAVLAREVLAQSPLTFAPRGAIHVDVAQLDAWVGVVEAHEAGELDAALRTAAQWSNADLRRLWLNVQALIQLVADPDLAKFRVRGSPDLPGRGRADTTVSFAQEYDHDTARAIAKRVDAIGLSLALKRAALVHTDATTLAADLVSRSAGTTMAGTAMQSQIGDGNRDGLQSVSVHGAIARVVLRGLPPDAREQAFVRDWYRATVANSQRVEYWDALQLDHALDLFPSDPVLLFLRGCQHEAYAAPLYQAFMRSLGDARMRPDIRAEADELEQAARAFRAALRGDPTFAEAQVHLGRVLSLQGQHAAAIDELAQALTAGLEPALEYYARIFLGAAYQQSGAWAPAREQFERARIVVPESRVAALALAQIAREAGQPEEVPDLLRRGLALPTPTSTVDPWWTYRVSHARKADAWLADVRRSGMRGVP